MDYTPVMPHGDLAEVFPDVFFVTGTSRPTFLGQAWQFSRNMVVVRTGESLTLLNTVRLDDAGLARLDALGRMTQVVRLGAFHGMDDAFYLDRSGARYIGLEGEPPAGARAADAVLRDGGEGPLPGSVVFRFATSAVPEAVLLLPQNGGVLISCDALQNWAEVDPFFDAASAEKMRAFGFIEPANIGPGWRQAASPARADFDRLLRLPFDHLLPAHGTPIVGGARERIASTVDRLFPPVSPA
jgi:hypothetical protein